MIQAIDERVGVMAIYDIDRGKTLPWCIKWGRRKYYVLKLDFDYPYREGRTRHHVFHVITKTLMMKLDFNTESEHWILVETDNGYSA